MPRIEFKHIVSFSSEDANNPAENLLKPESYYKWKCATGGESKAVVVIQLEKATQIHSIDIGNNGSAFVEILTGRSTWDNKEEYQVLLVASSFMSPAESKSGSNLTRVRMFGQDKLNKTVSNQKWDRIKIVCTQPYNKNDSFGLSFIQLHSPPEEEQQDVEKSKVEDFKTKIGRFTLKDETEDKDDITTGSYFSKRSKISTNETPSMAASARDASASIISGVLSSPASTKVTKTTHATTFVPKRDYNGTPKRDIQKPTIPADRPKQQDDSELSKTKAVDRRSKTEALPPSKKFKMSEKVEKKRNVPFNKLMGKVVFVLSGFKNPERSNLRDQASSMGAQYRPDWVTGCTHLICAFKNTPKFNQVKGKGKIVSHKWIIDCAKKKERLSIRQYRMDGGGSSSDDDSDDDSRVHGHTDVTDVSQKGDVEKITRNMTATTDHKDKGTMNDSEDPKPGPSKAGDDGDSDECDTEDELRKAREAMNSDDDDDPYGGSTEEESEGDAADVQDKTVVPDNEKKTVQRQSSLPALPDFYEGKHFLLYGDFDAKDRRLLTRYITAYNGSVDDYMSDKIQFVVSNEEWDKNFDEASLSNPVLNFVRSKWIFKCHELQKFVPFEQYRIQSK